MSDHSELKKLAEAATPGPWAYDGSYVCPARTEDGTTYVELWRSIADCHQPENTKFIAAANPAAVLALINEAEGLHAQHGRDSAELRSLCQARDDARKERDQLKAEVETLTAAAQALRDEWRKDQAEVERLTAELYEAKEFQPIGEACLSNRDTLRESLGLKLGEHLHDHVEALRKDAYRYRWLRNGSDYSVAVHEGPELDKVIDRAMSEAAKP